MDRDQIAIELIQKKFGIKNAAAALKLLDKLSEEDPLIAKNKHLYIENLLLLTVKQFSKTVPFIEELSNVSYFAASFFIEKLPVLLFYNILDEYIELMINIKDYGARNLAYLMGSSDLHTNDLEDILLETEYKYYKILLQKVIKNSSRLKIMSGPIMRQAHILNTIIPFSQIEDYFLVCIHLHETYGYDISTAFIENTSKILKTISLKNILLECSKLADINKEYLHLFLKYPEKSKLLTSKKSKINTNDNKTKIMLLEQNNLDSIQDYPTLLKDKYFYAMISNWPRYDTFQKNNILNQLCKNNYKQYVISNKKISKKISTINNSTNNKWFKKWIYATAPVTNEFIYSEIKKTLIPNCYYKFLTRKIFAINRNLFEKIKLHHNDGDILELITYLANVSINKEVTGKLLVYKELIEGNDSKFRQLYSNKDLYIKTWDRDPWIDYARSDELYSCTSLGKSADLYAPSYLSDISLTNLDIWNNDLRIGRIHLGLVKNQNDQMLILVDSIEGSDRLMRNNKRLESIYNAILNYSNYIGINKVFFNSELTFNNTPKLFVKYLRTKIKNDVTLFVNRLLPDGTVKELMPNPVMSYLESLKNKNCGLIKGFTIESS